VAGFRNGYFTAYSPARNQDYTVYCSDTGTGYVNCTGDYNIELEFSG